VAPKKRKDSKPKKTGKTKKTGKKKQPDNRTTQQRMDEFLSAYAESCNILWASRRAQIARRTHYDWKETRPNYAKAFARAKEWAADYLEAMAIERATDGWLEPVFYQGEQCGTVRRFDGGLMQLLLRGLKPQVYGSKTEITGPAGSPVQAKIEVVFVKSDHQSDV
jgi:hypothetical protein